MIRLIYKLLLFCLLPLTLLYLSAKSDLRSRIFSRFFPRINIRENKSKRIWIHAASAGEARQAVALAKYIKALQANIDFIFTSNTTSGLREAQKEDGLFAIALPFPFDFPPAINRIFKNTAPDLIILIERELWPELTCEARRKNIPVMVANARLPRKSLKSFRRLNFLFDGVFSYPHYLCRSRQDITRLEKAGIDKNKLSFAGDIKVDLQKTAENKSGQKAINGKLFIAASTHTGEEKIILDAFDKLLQAEPEYKLLIAPRYIDRSDAIRKMAQTHGYSTSCISNGSDTGDKVLVLDTFGELSSWLPEAEVVFVGGTLVDRGGHNLFEPILAGKPVLFGPHYSRWTDWAEDLCATGAARLVRNAKEISSATLEFSRQSYTTENAVETAGSLLAKHHGAMQRNSEKAVRLIGKA